jgi:hypothetical protein
MSGTPANMAHQMFNFQFHKGNEYIMSNSTGADAIAQVWFDAQIKFQSTSVSLPGVGKMKVPAHPVHP